MNIQEIRKKRKMSQCLFAKKIGVSQQAVASWETGSRKPTADKLPEIAKILGCKIDDLFKK